MAIIESVLERQGFEEYRGQSAAELRVNKSNFYVVSARFYMPFISPMEMVLLKQPAVIPTSDIIVIAEQIPFLEKGELVTKRIFVVKVHMSQEFCAMLYRNNGLLDSEIERIAVAGQCGKYNVKDDLQAMKFYEAEEELMEGYNLRTGITSADVHNERYPSNRREKQALNTREAKALVEQICFDYAMPMLNVARMPHTTAGKQAIVAKCMINSRPPFLHQAVADSILLNETLTILRSVVLHEMAHALDVYEFGAFSHGPTFITIYCELLHRYAGMDFEKSISHFESRGLYVANPIYSVEFKKLSNATRMRYQEEYSAFKEGLIQHGK